MLEWLCSFPNTSERLACSVLKEHLTSYLAHLTEQHYPPKTMHKYAYYLLCFEELVGKQDRPDVTQLSQSVEHFSGKSLPDSRRLSR